MNAESQLEKDVRREIYDVTMNEGAPPRLQRVADALGITREEAAGAFASLAECHMIVLQPDGELLMAGPFSAVPTPFRVVIPEPRSSSETLGEPRSAVYSEELRGSPRLRGTEAFGNCIWDALGIVAMLQRDAHIETSCADCGTAVRIDIADDALVAAGGFMHFALPPRDWWNDVVFT